jgi:uncharacterized protein (DUF4415 family)
MNAKNSKEKSKTDWDRLAKMSDKDIDYSDIPQVDKQFFKTGKLRLPKAKPLISIRIDEDVLNWFKDQGPGYQTRINAVLRMYKDAHTS